MKRYIPMDLSYFWDEDAFKNSYGIIEANHNDCFAGIDYPPTLLNQAEIAP
jgi:hypothetical protein